MAKPAESGTGLTPADAAMLKRLLDQFDSYTLKGSYWGLRELGELKSMQSKLRTRLYPLTPCELAAAGEKLIEKFGGADAISELLHLNPDVGVATAVAESLD
jgi:hypothetical protein